MERVRVTIWLSDDAALRLRCERSVTGKTMSSLVEGLITDHVSPIEIIYLPEYRPTGSEVPPPAAYERIVQRHA